jgi:hypothetical protein
MVTVLLCAVGLLVALSAHLAIKVAERRAREMYRGLVGGEAASSEPEDMWKEIRAIVGGWGCLVTALEFVRGLGVVLALAAGLYLVTGQ